MKSGIYVWKLNGVPKYVGKGKDVKTRMKNRHKRCTVLNRAIEKYGKDSFEKLIICYCEPEELNSLETYYIELLHTHISENGYNLTWGGEGTVGFKHKEETKKKMSELKTGTKMPEWFKSKMSIVTSGINNGMFGKNHSEETKKKISEKAKVKIVSDETRNKKRISMTGKKHSEESKKKSSESAKKRWANKKKGG